MVVVSRHANQLHRALRQVVVSKRRRLVSFRDLFYRTPKHASRTCHRARYATSLIAIRLSTASAKLPISSSFSCTLYHFFSAASSTAGRASNATSSPRTTLRTRSKSSSVRVELTHDQRPRVLVAAEASKRLADVPRRRQTKHQLAVHRARHHRPSLARERRLVRRQLHARQARDRARVQHRALERPVAHRRAHRLGVRDVRERPHRELARGARRATSSAGAASARSSSRDARRGPRATRAARRRRVRPESSLARAAR